jgi:NAD(P)-dependent dehydrogenase (short-subunit alcohol dehydrogenase family)
VKTTTKGLSSGKIMSDNKGLMAGKRGLIMGVANNRSIAWGIAQACARHGAELAFTYQGDAIKKRVEPLAAEIGAKIVVPCDVTDMASIDATFAAIEKAWGKLDFVVHAIAFSDKDELTGRYVDTTAENFSKTMFISCYSFTAVAQCVTWQPTSAPRTFVSMLFLLGPSRPWQPPALAISVTFSNGTNTTRRSAARLQRRKWEIAGSIFSPIFPAGLPAKFTMWIQAIILLA